MKIYYAHSIKGTHTLGERIPGDIIVFLKQNGHSVLSEECYTQDPKINLSDKEIYIRDIEMINQSDLVLANITNPSLGVGYEIAYAESIRKKIVCFYQTLLGQRVSSMIVGNPNFSSYGINSLNDICYILESLNKF